MGKAKAFSVTVFTRSMDAADAQALYACRRCVKGLQIDASNDVIADVWVDNVVEPGHKCDRCGRIAGGRIAQLRRVIREDRQWRARAAAARKSWAHHERYHGDRCIYGTSECEAHEHHAEEE